MERWKRRVKVKEKRLGVVSVKGWRREVFCGFEFFYSFLVDFVGGIFKKKG